MPIADKKFFTERYNEIKSILNAFGVAKCALNFQPSKTQIFLEFKDKKNFYGVEEALMKLCNQYGTAYTVSFSAFSVNGQSLLGSKAAIDFEDLKPEIKASVENNDEAKVKQVKDQIIQASNVANETAKALINLSKTVQSSSDIDMIYKTTNFEVVVNSLAEIINSCQKLEKELYKQHSESHQGTAIFFTPNT